jgi:hypothetical protein
MNTIAPCEPVLNTPKLFPEPPLTGFGFEEYTF